MAQLSNPRRWREFRTSLENFDRLYEYLREALDAHNLAAAGEPHPPLNASFSFHEATARIPAHAIAVLGGLELRFVIVHGQRLWPLCSKTLLAPVPAVREISPGCISRIDYRQSKGAA